MITNNIQVTYNEGDHWRNLPHPQLRCAEAAIQAMQSAYAPYSNFSVGAAILTSSGGIVIGSNQENAAYPHCLCAEQVCVHHHHHSMPTDNPVLMAIAIKGPRPAMPCGGCRQVLHEWSMRHDATIPLITLGLDGPYLYFEDVRSLLPLAFSSSDLLKDGGP